MDIIERTVGDIPVSIGTALAFAGLLGTLPEPIRQPVDLKSVREVWVNLRTLARNLYAAMPSEATQQIDLVGAVDVLEEEVKTLSTVLAQHGSKCRVRFYMASKDAIKWAFPHANFKQAKTPKQLGYDMYERFCSIELFQRIKASGVDVLEIDRLPPKTDGTVALITHFPTELLWRSQFARLLLLESHTGKLKTFNQWYTKLNGIKEDTLMPFNSFTLQVFGDSVVLDSQSIKVKKQLKELAVAKRWTGMTTQDKIHHDIMSSKSEELIAAYKQLRR
jgi:hypothetical protein